MSEEFIKFMNHAKKVIKDVPATREVLQGVKLFKNGNAVVTDARRLYFIKDIHDSEGLDTVITPSGKEINGKYPDTSRILPFNQDPEQQLPINVAEFTTAMDLMQTAAKLNDIDPHVKIEGRQVSLINALHVRASYELPEIFAKCFYCNASYWVDALNLFKAFGYRTIIFNFYGKLRPFTLLSKDERLTALILPVRVGGL